MSPDVEWNDRRVSIDGLRRGSESLRNENRASTIGGSRASRVERRKSKVEGLEAKVEGRRTRVEGRGSRVESRILGGICFSVLSSYASYKGLHKYVRSSEAKPYCRKRLEAGVYGP